MKKLLYTLLAVSIIFSACEEDTPLPAANNNNNSINTNLSIGDTHQGGIIFYLYRDGGGLIAAPTDQSYNAEWGCMGTDLSGAGGIVIGTGAQNTINIETECNTPGTAAYLCANLTLGGYSDWFLPSKDELMEMYWNIGIGNAYYLGNIGGFSNGTYWSSTEQQDNEAYSLLFTNNFFNYLDKDTPLFVRAVRAF